jgi:hypothetical protein
MVVVVTLVVSSVQAESARQSVTVYAGPATRQYVSNIVFHGNFAVDGTTLGLAYDRRIFDLGAGLTLEIEGQVAHSFMDTPYTSMGAGLGVRFDTSRWTRQPSSVAFYSGPSYADDGGTKRRRLLEFVTVEFAVQFMNRSKWDGVFRMFHRSGAFGLYGNHTDTGSMLGVGVRRRF